MGEDYIQKSFTFFLSYYDAAYDLDDEERLAFYDTVLAYIFKGEDGEQQLRDSGMKCAYFAFKGIKANLKTSRSRASAGHSGNNKNSGEEITAHQDENQENSDENQEIPDENQDANQKKSKQNQCKSGGKANPKQTEHNKEVEVEVEVEEEVEREREKEEGGEVKDAPPTIEDVSAFCRDESISVDANRFVSFYASKGWKIGGDPMVDWRAAVRSWAARDGGGKPAKVDKHPPCPECGSKHTNYQQTRLHTLCFDCGAEF